MSLEESISIYRTEERRQWLQVMLPRIAGYSDRHRVTVVVPEKMYHGSPYADIREFDVTRGQGLGTWFQPNSVEAARFSVDRSRYLEHATPSVYEAKLNFSCLAVLPCELDLYGLRLVPDESEKGWEASPFSLSEIGKIIRREGYDGIYLQKEDSFSALDARAIQILSEQRASPIFNEQIRPRLERGMGKNFGSVYNFLHKLSC
jgi:hypothetical protein